MTSDAAKGPLARAIEITWQITLLVTYAALVLDSYRNQQSFLKLTGISSPMLLLIAMISTYVVRAYTTATIPSFLLKFFQSILLPFTAIIGIGLTLINAATSANFVFGHTSINFQQIVYVAILTGWIVLWHRPKAWLRQHEEKIIFVSGWIFLTLAWIISLWPFDVFIRLSEEDRLVEHSQFMALVVGASAAVQIAKKLFKAHMRLALLFIMGAIGLFAVAGDEIAWGQRLFNIAAPAYFQANNVQQEVTFHNLSDFPLSISHLYLLVGFWGWTSWHIADKLKTRLPQVTRFFISSWYLFPYFYIPFLFNVRIALGPHEIGRWSEVMELMLYLGVTIFLIQINRHFAHHLDPEPQTA